jgi:hypothetical protein
MCSNVTRLDGRHWGDGPAHLIAGVETPNPGASARVLSGSALLWPARIRTERAVSPAVYSVAVHASSAFNVPTGVQSAMNNTDKFGRADRPARPGTTARR